MIYKQLTATDLQTEFRQCDRDYYSLEAYQAMIELSEENDIELDVIALCGSFTEATADDIVSDYGLDSIDELFENTYVIELSNGDYFYANY